MPLYDFKCDNCKFIRKDIYVSLVKRDEVVACPHCGRPMYKLVSIFHLKKGTSVDGKDPGKVIEEKNIQLKKKWGGYKHEEQKLRDKINKKVEEKLSKSKI